MLVYRVFPYVAGVRRGEPGHPLYLHPDQGMGRWDNPDRYQALYVATGPSAAIGETFAHLTRWSSAMLPVPTVRNAERALATYFIDEERAPVLDLDDATVLAERGLRPTDVVIRNRPRTQGIAAGIHAERRWAGLSWWSMHRPQWTLYVLWDLDGLITRRVESLPGHPGVLDAARLLAKEVDDDLR